MTVDRNAAGEAIRHLDGAAASIQERAERIVQAANRRAAGVVRGIATELASRERELAQARAELDRCRQSEHTDCSAAVARLRRAEAAVIQARAALASARATRSELRARLGAREERIRKLVADSRRDLADRKAELRDYLALAGTGAGSYTPSTTGRAATASLGGGGNTTCAGLIDAAGLPQGFALVPLNLIDQSASTVHGPADFKKGYSPDDLAWAFDAFQQVVLPALAAGEGRDYFHTLDQRAGLQGTRSYSMTYSQLIGAGDAIRLNPQPNGTYAIANGQHRVWVAAQYGVLHIPARIM